MVTLVKDTIDNDDIDKLIEWLKTYPRLTKGEVTVELEAKWSNWLGCKYCVFVNSGSSANLLMLSALDQAKKISSNAQIVVPAISWPTDLSPVMQLGFEPILVDCNLDDLSVNLEHLEQIFETKNPEVLILVSVLGLVPDMGKIISLCNEYEVLLLEDTCEGMGSKYGGKNLGTFGLMSSFSLYFGHHISTIEGGFISTDDEEMYNILLSLRSHGWLRDNQLKIKEKLHAEWKTNSFNEMYTFYYSGFNLRSTDLQAFIGLGQIDKLEAICKKRNENFLKYNECIKTEWKPKYRVNDFVSNFAYPIIDKRRDDMVAELLANSIEVRPLISGSMGNQPFYVKKYGKKVLPNSNCVDENGFYVPNHQNLTHKEIMLITEIINEITT